MSANKKQLKSILPKYSSNPSITTLQMETRKRKVFANSNKALIITDVSTGTQSMAQAGATFIEEETIDTEQFIKLYSFGVKQLAGLSKAGYNLFQIIYEAMLDKPNEDKFYLEYNDLTDRRKYKNARKTFIGAVNELLQKDIIYQSNSLHMYYINVKLFFNGDRINVIKSYRKKSNNELENQPTLFDELE
jgi:hypothetical protein